MDQDTTDWLPTANGSWIGCTEEGKVVYKNKELKEAWEKDDGRDVRKAKSLIEDWASARKSRAANAEGHPNAFGGQAEKDKTLKNNDALVERFKAQATQAVNEAYGIS